MKMPQPNHLYGKNNFIEHERPKIKSDETESVTIKEETNEEITSTSLTANSIHHLTAVSIIQHVDHTANITAHRGRYGFRIEYVTEERLPSKCCNYTYSSSLNRLFIQKMKVVPLKFVWEIDVPFNEIEIRSYLIFKQTFIHGMVVDRCPHHLSEDYNLSISHHVMEAVGEGTSHPHCPGTQRYITVLMPYNMTNYNINQFTGNLRFRCSSTCRGGIDRRPILALFDLYIKNKYEGRSVLEVSICSSPGRDRLNNENKNVLGKRNGDISSIHVPNGEYSREPKRVRTKSLPQDTDDDRYYFIKVKGEENAIIMQKIAAALNAQT